MSDEKELWQRLGSLEAQMKTAQAGVHELKSELKAVTHRLNTLILTSLSLLASALLGLFLAIIKFVLERP